MTAQKALDDFTRVFEELSEESAYALGGTLTAPKVEQLKLYVASDTQTKSFSLPLDDEAAKTLYELGSPSPHDRGGQAESDETCGRAREIKTPHVALSHDLLYTTSIVPILTRRLGLEAPVIKLSKLDMYTEGGFLEACKVTPLAEDHVGSIVICIPSIFEGGQLVVKQQGEEREFDYASDATNGLLAWTFLCWKCEHEILPVTKGTRVTLVYDVHLPIQQEYLVSIPPSISDSRASPMLKALQAILLPENRAQSRFMIEGGLLGVALVHEYPINTSNSEARGGAYIRDLPGRLTGIDRIMYEAILATGMTLEINAIYWNDEDHYWFRDPGSEPDYQVGRYDAPLYRAPSFFTMQDCELDDERKLEEYGAISTFHMKWLNPPSGFEVENQYINHDREKEYSNRWRRSGIDYIYACPALVIEVPTVSGERPEHNLDDWEEALKRRR